MVETDEACSGRHFVGNEVVSCCSPPINADDEVVTEDVSFRRHDARAEAVTEAVQVEEEGLW